MRNLAIPLNPDVVFLLADIDDTAIEALLGAIQLELNDGSILAAYAVALQNERAVRLAIGEESGRGHGLFVCSGLPCFLFGAAAQGDCSDTSDDCGLLPRNTHAY